MLLRIITAEDISEARKICEEAGVGFTAFKADLSDEKQVYELAKKINECGDIYGLVNNAGVCIFEDFLETPAENFDFMFDVNIKAPFILTQQIAKQMRDRGIKGRIVNFSSITAISASATQVHYGAAKGAVASFTRMAADALGKYGITVNGVMPGPIPDKTQQRIPCGRGTKGCPVRENATRPYGDPSNIADAVVYFLGEGASWTTGALLPVDGGYLSK